MKRTIICCLVFTALSCGEVQAQVSASNPSEWIALAEGNDLINKQISKQMGGQSATAALQNTIAAEFNQIHKWQDKYNSYLKTVNGFASSLKVCHPSLQRWCAHLYHAGQNPQGH